MKYRNSYLSYFLMYAFYYIAWSLSCSLISVYLSGKGFSAVVFLYAEHLAVITIAYSLLMVLVNGTNPVMEKIATASPL